MYSCALAALLLMNLASWGYAMEQTKSIFEAVSAGDIEALEGILKKDPSLVNVRNEKEQTPLYIAAAEGNVEAAKLLLSHGADVNGGAEGWDWRPIVHAAWNNRIEMVKLLIQHGADVTRTGGQPVHYAGQRRHKEVCRILVEAGAIDDLIDPPDPDVISVFRAAYSYDSKALAEILKSKPGLADARDVDGRAPMHEAGTNGAFQVVKVLINAGADVNAKNDSGETPVQRAAAHGHRDVVRLLVDAGAEVDMLTACKMNMIDQVKKIIDRDPDQVNLKYNNFLVIEYAAEAGFVELGRLLADAGAFVDIFSAASFGLNDAVLERLDEDLSLVNAKRGMYEYQPLHCAAECGHPETVKLLIEKGADVNGRNAWGFTPLHLSVIGPRDIPPDKGHLQVTQLLMEHGADVNARDEYGRNVLKLAEDAANQPEPGVAKQILDLIVEMEAR